MGNREFERLASLYNNEELEQLFDSLDQQLHKKTYLQLEDITFAQAVEIEEMQSTIDFYREKAENE